MWSCAGSVDLRSSVSIKCHFSEKQTEHTKVGEGVVEGERGGGGWMWWWVYSKQRAEIARELLNLKATRKRLVPLSSSARGTSDARPVPNRSRPLRNAKSQLLATSHQVTRFRV